MVNLQFKDGENKLALMKDFQVDPTKRELIHADFFEVLLTEKVKVHAHVSTVRRAYRRKERWRYSAESPQGN